MSITPQPYNLVPYVAERATEKVKRMWLVEQRPRWFALWIDTDPSAERRILPVL